MSVTYDDRKRQAIPRCLSYETACLLGLLRVNRRQEQVHRNEVKNSDASRQWIENPRTSTAVDVVAEALILKDFESSEAIKAAKYILRKGSSSSPLIRQLADHFLGKIETPLSILREPEEIPDTDSQRIEIARLKRSVRNYPVNPIAWSDLSLSYATVGQADKAKMAMNVAMSLAKSNRFVLRSASRCFLHFEEPDRAVDILNKSGLCAIDPWIASAEIAIAESKGLKSKCISKAKDLIEDDNLTPFSRGELAASLGTMEIKSGSIRRAKKIMRKAIIDPTENALAQVEWASSIHDIDFNDMIELRKSVPASYEATAVHTYYSKEFAESLKASKKWGRFQFLSSRPIIHSTFIASSMLNDDLGAIDIFDNALPVQKESPLAINNYAFALARVGRTGEAEDKVRECINRASREEELALTATTGLICFREGNVGGGRRLYNIAVNGFELLKNYRSAAIAEYYWAVEEKRIKSENAENKIRAAKKAIEQHNVFGFEDLAKKL
jgi:tetratricopeptide (TPR) repeat protein